MFNNPLQAARRLINWVSAIYYPPQSASIGNYVNLAKAKYFCAVFVVGLHSALLVTNAMGATITASSCSNSDVQTAINTSTNGDTISVPAGNCTWTSIVDIGSKAITLQGAGIGLTNITHNVSGSQIHLINFGQDATIPTRITGFSFLNGSYDHRMIACSGSYSSAPFRLDHNSFMSNIAPTMFVDIFGGCKGLIDHNDFTAPDNSEMIHNWGPGTSGWSDDVTPGSPDALYVEDNTFTNNSSAFNASSALQSYEGSRTVVRHNTFNDSQVDQHGGSNIGARWWEFYENTFTTKANYYQDKYFDIRAGSGVVFNNHHTGASSNAMIIFRDESRPGDARYDVGEGINRNHWSLAYVWGNDSSMPVGIGSGSTVIAQGTNFIVSATQPANMKRRQLSTDGASTTYNYTPYTYPHPLTLGQRPVAPVALKIMP